MQFKDILIALAATRLATAAPTPQDPLEPEFPSDGEDIVGGVTAAAAEFPFIVSLQQSGSHFCGGTLLNANTVVTAAHCSTGQSASSVTVRAGSNSRTSGGVLVRVSAIRINPSYGQASSYDGDVAIWKLATAIPTSSTVAYASLPASGSDPAGGSVATVAGWGTTSSGGQSLPVNLLKVDVPIVARTTCRSNYSTASITTNMICAGVTSGGKDSCQGDSGGPIVNSSKQLIGIVSWGQGCAQAGKPGVYTRVGAAPILSYITANL